MIPLQPGKSYLSLFGMFFAVFAGTLFTMPNVAAAALPIFMVVVLSSELRSGIVLDEWWRAAHPAGTWRYKLGIAVQVVFTIAFTVFAVLFSRM